MTFEKCNGSVPEENTGHSRAQKLQHLYNWFYQSSWFAFFFPSSCQWRLYRRVYASVPYWKRTSAQSSLCTVHCPERVPYVVPGPTASNPRTNTRNAAGQGHLDSSVVGQGSSGRDQYSIWSTPQGSVPNFSNPASTSTFSVKPDSNGCRKHREA